MPTEVDYARAAAKKTKNPEKAHAAIAEQYASDAIASRVLVCGLVKKAAQRHFNDLKRSDNDSSYPYRFDRAKGERVCRFIECLPHTNGEWAEAGRRERLILQPWQLFIIVLLFGWVRKDDGMRRFRTAYLELPRGQGKSTLAAAVGLYMLLADGEMAAEIYSGACTERQAFEVFTPAKRMLERTPQLRKAFGAEVCAKSLVVLSKGSKFQPIIGNPGDGSHPSCAIIDEYHEHDTSRLHDTMRTGMGPRRQPLLFIITTAGFNIAGPCHEKHEDACKILDGTLDNENFFACIYGLDETDDWTDPQSLIKANPNYGISVKPDYLLAEQRQAMFNPIEQTMVKTKYLNVWCSVATGWMNMQLWKLAEDPMLEEKELIGSECFIGVDLASKVDLCSEQRLYRRELNGAPHYYLFSRYWLPEKAIEEPGPNHAHYEKWVKMELLRRTQGAYVDFDLITETIIADCKRINPVEVVFDPFNAVQMMNDLTNAGVKNVVEFEQRPARFAVPMDEFMSALKDGRLHHAPNQINDWCFSNVVAAPTQKGLFWPTRQKNKPHQKIDGAIAAIMAMARACAQPEAQPEYQLFTL